MKLYCFWTGQNEMSHQRQKCFETMKNTNLDVTLVTSQNLHDYIKFDEIHEGYKYLSETHKSDYLRTYFMHFYGGAYCDIKNIQKSWEPAAKLLETNPDIWMVGYGEAKAGDVPKIHADPELDVILHKEWYKLIGNGGYICKSRTPLTQEWYDSMICVMDKHLENLKKYPARYPQEVYSNGYPYPLRWAELLGEVFHPICYKYYTHVSNILPAPSFTGYR